jgi:hypothetical protein
MANALLYLFEEVYESNKATITGLKQDQADLSAFSIDSADFQANNLL